VAVVKFLLAKNVNVNPVGTSHVLCAAVLCCVLCAHANRPLTTFTCCVLCCVVVVQIGLATLLCRTRRAALTAQ
jgi:hypothetical protein